MKRKIDSKELQIGMYVSELDRPWLETPFLFQGFQIASQGDIQELQRNCDFVYIDEARSDYQATEADTTAAASERQTISPQAYSKPAPKIAIEEEIARAREVQQSAEQQLTTLFQQLRSDQEVDSDQVQQLVGDLYESLVRNPDALLLLNSLKNLEQAAETHAIGTSVLAISLGRYMHFSQQLIEELGMAALLHDVGEVQIPLEVIHRNPRSAEDNALLKRHPEFGAAILRNTPGIPDSVVDAAYSHHEQIDGHGFPRGVSGDAMTLFAKIVAIVNTYDQLTRGDQAHSMSPSEALRHLYQCRDTLFDAQLTEAFIQCLGVYPVGSLVELYSGEVGIVIASPPGEHLHPRLMLVRTPNKQPYKPPRLINLANFVKGSESKQYAIRQVLPPDAYGVDIRAYLLSETVL